MEKKRERKKELPTCSHMALLKRYVYVGLTKVTSDT